MNQKTFITSIEREKCNKTVNAYKELFDNEDIAVIDAGKYGFVKLQYYNPVHGFDCVTVFTNGDKLFEDLWQEWITTELLELAYGTTLENMTAEEIFQHLPEDKQTQLMKKRDYFYEKCR